MPTPEPKHASKITSKVNEPSIAYGTPAIADNFLGLPDWPDVPLPEYSTEEAFLLSLRHAYSLLPITGIQPWIDRQSTMNTERFEL